MYYKKMTVLAAAVLLGLSTLCGCGTSGTYTSVSQPVQLTFNDVFLSFNDLRTVGNELMNEPISDDWWAKFDSVSVNIKAIEAENNKLIEGGTLSSTDLQLAAALGAAVSGYSDGFRTMSAARESENADIINNSLTEFAAKLVVSNTAWDTAVAAITKGN